MVDGLEQPLELRVAVEPALRLHEAAVHFAITAQKVCNFAEFYYAAYTWGKSRPVIARIEHTDKGANPRYIITHIPGRPKRLYHTL
ncbi:MAG: hypothetical protein GKR94_25305 [Gammaproteobacteria bacterium]|nr:hypothetical protein [Gammaproteobacteria bacterium]